MQHYGMDYGMGMDYGYGNKPMDYGMGMDYGYGNKPMDYGMGMDYDKGYGHKKMSDHELLKHALKYSKEATKYLEKFYNQKYHGM